MIKTIIFDYDGVIVDSFPTVHATYQIICRELGKPCPTDLEEFRRMYGDTSNTLMKNLGFDSKDVAKANVLFKNEILKQHPSLFRGIKETLEELSKKYVLVLVSSNLKSEITQKLSANGLLDYFFLIAGSELGSLPKVDSIRNAMKQTHSSPEETLMIGDRSIDFLEGTAAGLTPSHIILVEYGWGYEPPRVSSPNWRITRPAELVRVVEKVDRK